MKTYTFKFGRLAAGIALESDERFGQVVFLGQEGRGRRYERVTLDRHNPAKVDDKSVVLAAQPRKVTLPRLSNNLFLMSLN
jgi:hypothetical protein